MKLVINKCFGGFGLSRKAVKRIAELQGRECYFFTHQAPSGEFHIGKYFPASIDDTSGGHDLFWSAFDIPNPNDVLINTDNWNSMTPKQKADSSAIYKRHELSSRPDDRTAPLLIQVVEELGHDADGGCARLAIVEIPDGVEWEIDEYDGQETIHERHRSWG